MYIDVLGYLPKHINKEVEFTGSVLHELFRPIHKQVNITPVRIGGSVRSFYFDLVGPTIYAHGLTLLEFNAGVSSSDFNPGGSHFLFEVLHFHAYIGASMNTVGIDVGFAVLETGYVQEIPLDFMPWFEGVNLLIGFNLEFFAMGYTAMLENSVFTYGFSAGIGSYLILGLEFDEEENK